MPSQYAQGWQPGQPVADEFFAIAAQVYDGDPHWIPENQSAIRAQFSADNPYFERCEAEIFLAKDQCRLVGFFNGQQPIEGETVAYFGYWETVNDVELNREIFSEFFDWAKKKGATRVYGPINFTTYGDNRLRIDSFGESAFIGEPYNPDYYPSILEKLSFDKKFGYMSQIAPDVNQVIKLVSPAYHKMMQQIEGQFTVERLTGDIWMDNLDVLYPLVDLIFRQNFAYSPISEATFKKACGESFAKKLDPETSVLVRDAKGRIAGFFIVYPDYGELVNQSGKEQHAVTADTVNFAEHYPLLSEPRLALAKTGGVHPDYRSAGLFTLMSMQVTLWAEDRYERIAGAMVREDNHSLNYAKHGEIQRNYALFQRALSDLED